MLVARVDRLGSPSYECLRRWPLLSSPPLFGHAAREGFQVAHNVFSCDLPFHPRERLPYRRHQTAETRA